jgi:hypothetical protein
MPGSRWLHGVCVALAAAGFCLHSYTVLFLGDYSADVSLFGFALSLWLWSLLPYAVGFFLYWKLSWQLRAAGWLLCVLVMDLVMHWSVFIEPQGSTAALGLLFMPLWNLLVVGPVGALFGWMTTRLATSSRKGN